MIVVWIDFMLKLNIYQLGSIFLIVFMYIHIYFIYFSISRKRLILFKKNHFLEYACLFSAFFHGRSFLHFFFIGDRRRYIVHVKIRISQLTRGFRKSAFTTLIHFSSSIIRSTGFFSQLWLSSIFSYFHTPL